ncbi:MAG: hypothetical protein ABI840_03545 [bacterium]
MPVDFHSYDGKNQLQDHCKKLIKNNHPYKTFFLFDCDAETEYEDCKKFENEIIKTLKIPRNDSNKKVKNGIENLFNENLFEERFYDVDARPKPDGGFKTETKLNKGRFYESIIERNQKQDFENFNAVFDLIKKNL